MQSAYNTDYMAFFLEMLSKTGIYKPIFKF